MRRQGKISFKESYLNDNARTLRHVLAQYPLDIRQRKFNILTPELKAAIWKNRIQEILNTNLFSNSQLILLEEILKKITPQIYVENSLQYEKFLVFVKKWENLALLVFSRKFLTKAISVLDDQHNPNEKQDAGDGSTGDCHCSTSSDYCDQDTSKCTKYKCNQSMFGCGAFFIFTCNGICLKNGISTTGVYVSDI